MATKLYPPELEGTLPAFCKNYNKKKELLGATLKIPFGLNRAVNNSSISNMTIRIRTASTNTFLLSDRAATSIDLE